MLTQHTRSMEETQQPTWQPPKFTPINDMVIVEIAKKGPTKLGALEIPPTAKDPNRKVIEAIVLATGPGRYNSETGERIPVAVEVGQRVLVGNQCSEFKYEGFSYLTMREANIVALVEE